MPVPANAVLLKRTVRSLVEPPDLYAVREWYYDPATRTAAEYPADNSSDDSTYTRPRGEIIDRYCLAPGQAPYREAQVQHRYATAGSVLGTGDVQTGYVDGVSTCMIVCTLGLTLSSSSAGNGRFDIIATATAPTGPILFSTDDFATAGRVGTAGPGGSVVLLLPGLLPGTYKVRVRETRTAGCSATATITLTPTYGPRYTLAYADPAQVPCTLDIFEREYTGPVSKLTASPNPVSLDYPGGASDHVFTTLLLGSQCQLSLLLTTQQELQPLYSGDERLHRVDYRRAGVLHWRGYLLPEQYDVAFLAPPNNFNLSATDGLGALSDAPFAGPGGQALGGDWTVLAIIRYCLDKLDLHLPLRVLCNLLPLRAPSGSPALEQVKYDVAGYISDKGKPMDCGKVLRALLNVYQARLYQQGGAWWFERLIELGTGPLTYTAYNADGVRTADVTRSLLVEIGPAYAPDKHTQREPHWVDELQRQGLQAAVSRVEITVEEQQDMNLIAFALPTNADLPGPYPPSWAAFSTTQDSFSQLYYTGKGKTPGLRLRLPDALVPSLPNPATPLIDPATLLVPYLQLPVTPQPLPLHEWNGNNEYGTYFTLSFTAKVSGVTPGNVFATQPKLYAAYQLGSGPWQFTGTLPASFNADGTYEVAKRFGAPPATVAPDPVRVRLYAPIGGATAATVDITDLSVTWGFIDPGVGDLSADVYTSTTGQLVSRVDDSLSLFHVDTPRVRRTGTLLDPVGAPTAGWLAPEAPGQAQEIGAWVAAGRNLFQAAPAQVLTGPVYGEPFGPGALLTDPSEANPAIYLLTSYGHDSGAREQTVRAVQLRTLLAPVRSFPDNAIYLEDLAAWMAEDGRILVYENA